VFDDLLQMIGESSDPTAAAVALVAGFARFLATRGVTARLCRRRPCARRGLGRQRARLADARRIRPARGCGAGIMASILCSD